MTKELLEKVEAEYQRGPIGGKAMLPWPVFLELRAALAEPACLFMQPQQLAPCRVEYPGNQMQWCGACLTASVREP